ncbi:MAG: sugar phosphate nucleotidyltransferase, partial [Elusimicrobiota bacterium]
PLIVMNGDLLTKIDLKSLLDFHSEEKNLATVCVREYDFQVPFGVIEMRDHRLTRIIEKPTHRFFVSAGIYVVEPKILKRVPRDKYFGMPDLLELLRRSKPGSIGCFPIREYWIDIGQMKDFERAQADYPKFF